MMNLPRPKGPGYSLRPFHGQCGLERFSTPHQVNPSVDVTERLRFLHSERGGLGQCCG